MRAAVASRQRCSRRRSVPASALTAKPATTPPTPQRPAGRGISVCPSHGTTRVIRHVSVVAHASPAPGMSRVEQQAARALAVDVEYVHVRLVGEDSRYTKMQLPAEVCLVDCRGRPLVLTKIDAVAEVDRAEGQELVFDGGIPLEDVRGQPLLSEVRKLLVERVGDRLLVGHNLAKDLLALGMTDRMVPAHQRRDTMMYAALQNEKGCGRSLAELTELKLGRKIQRGSRHSSEEDAKATMELYLGWCHFDERLMNYEDLVEYQVSRILAGRGEHDQMSEMK